MPLGTKWDRTYAGDGEVPVVCFVCGVVWCACGVCCVALRCVALCCLVSCRLVSVVLLLVRSCVLVTTEVGKGMFRGRKKQDLTSVAVPQNKTISVIIHTVLDKKIT